MESFLSPHVRALLSKSSTPIDNNQTSLECIIPQTSCDVTPITSLDVTSQTSLKYVTRQNVFDEESIKQNLLPDFDLADLDQSKWKQGSAVNGTFSMFVVVN